MVKALKIEVPDDDKYVKNAIKSGFQQFWGAKPWSFKVRTSTLSITSEADTYDLPADFDSMLSLREETSNMGFKLVYMDKEQFDEVIPKQSFYSGNDSLIYTIFNVEDSDIERPKKVLSVHPRPSSTTLYLTYNRTIPENLEDIPDKFQSGLEACVSSHIFMPGFDQRIKAYNEARAEIRRLEVQDNLDRSDISQHLIEGSRTIKDNLRWWNY